MADVIGTTVFQSPRFFREGTGVNLVQDGVSQALTIMLDGGVFGMSTTDTGSLNYDLIAAAIEKLDSEGGGNLFLPSGRYGISQPLTVDKQGIRIIGQGGGGSRSGNPTGIRATAKTCLYAVDNGTMAGASLLTWESASGGVRLTGGGIEDVMLDGNAIAAHSFRQSTWGQAIFRNLSMVYATDANLFLDVITTVGYLTGGSYGNRENQYHNCFVTSNTGTGTAEYTACINAYAVRSKVFEAVDDPDENESDAIGNPTVCFNHFYGGVYQSKAQHCFRLEGMTDNHFYNIDTRIQDDPANNTYATWLICSADQDTRLGLAVTKRNNWYSCTGKFYVHQAQSGGNNPKGNRAYGHQTSTRMRFSLPYTVESPGTIETAGLTVENDIGDITGAWQYAQYTNIETRYQKGGIRSKTVTLTTAAGATATATDFIPAGSVLLGLTCHVKSVVAGPTSFDIGDGSDVDRWGDGIPYAEHQTSDLTDWSTVGAGIGTFPAAQSVVLTANGGNFAGGTVDLAIWYFTAESAYALSSSAVYRGMLSESTAGTTATFSNAYIGAPQSNRVIVLGIHVTSAISGVTIGGVAATQIASLTTDPNFYLYALADTADETNDIVITCGSSSDRFIAAVWSVYTSSATPTDTATDYQTGTTNATASFDVVDEGSVIIFGGQSSAVTGPVNAANYTGIDTLRRNFQGTFDSLACIYAGLINTNENATNSITLSETTSGPKSLLVACFGA